LSYLQPPPMPAPVVVQKDVGGYVTDYEAQTAVYRGTGREVRLHECRSACTLALSLPNVCVYPDSILKFHQAYDPRNRQTNDAVSQQLFNSYPAAVRARLGGLTRAYRVLRGSELIGLGIRNCNDTKTMVATAAVPRKVLAPRVRTDTPPSNQGSLFDGLVQGVMAVFDPSVDPLPALATRSSPAALAKATPAETIAAAIPLPPPRPSEFVSRTSPSVASEATGVGGSHADHSLAADGNTEPKPAWSLGIRPNSVGARVISGAHAILPARFAAYAAVR
jgi:hypothetical protein